jgi:hypothetical protein
MIYDFYEVLGRGIIAARTGRNAEAIKYLELAAKIEPGNPRVWLWLAAVEEDAAQKQSDLETVLRIDANNLVAKILLERLSRREVVVARNTSDFAIFTCPFCGGKQYFDPDLSAMKCGYCKKVERLILSDAAQDEKDLDSALQKDTGNWAVLKSQADCGACGAKTSLPMDQATLRCPFCDSDLITIHPATPGLIPPTAIAPFQLHGDDVLGILAEQLDVNPAQFERFLSARQLIISPIYLPFWTFDGRVQILCNFEYRVMPVEYSSDERVIAKGDWPEAKSWYECDIDDLPVYAAHGVPEATLSKILPFDLKSILEYRPEIMAGWQAEYYQVALKDAEVAAHKRMRDVAFNQAARRGLFMEPSRMLQNDVLVMDQTYKFVLLPVYIIKSSAPDRNQKTFINGQTGKATGNRASWWKRIFG